MPDGLIRGLAEAIVPYICNQGPNQGKIDATEDNNQNFYCDEERVLVLAAARLLGISTYTQEPT